LGFLAILIGLHFAPPFFWGLNGVSAKAAIAWAVFMAAEAVFSGWRAPQRGFVFSFFIGTVFASLWCVPAYYLGSLAFSLEGFVVGPVRIVAIILFAYVLTGIWILWRGFNEPNVVKRPFFVSQFHHSKNWTFIVGVALMWLPSTVFAMTLAGTRLSHLKREGSYWTFFLVLIALGLLFLRF